MAQVLLLPEAAVTVCDVTNPPFEEPAYSNTMEKLYGDRIAGMHGYRCGLGLE